MKKLIVAIKFGVWAYRNPLIFRQNIFEMLGKLFELIIKVSTEGKPYATALIFVEPKTGKPQEIVSIWAGTGIGAKPMKRIQELLEENDLLKAELFKKEATK